MASLGRPAKVRVEGKPKNNDKSWKRMKGLRKIFRHSWFTKIRKKRGEGHSEDKADSCSDLQESSIDDYLDAAINMHHSNEKTVSRCGLDKTGLDLSVTDNQSVETSLHAQESQYDSGYTSGNFLFPSTEHFGVPVLDRTSEKVRGESGSTDVGDYCQKQHDSGYYSTKTVLPAVGIRPRRNLPYVNYFHDASIRFAPFDISRESTSGVSWEETYFNSIDENMADVRKFDGVTMESRINYSTDELKETVDENDCFSKGQPVDEDVNIANECEASHTEVKTHHDQFPVGNHMSESMWSSCRNETSAYVDCHSDNQHSFTFILPNQPPEIDTCPKSVYEAEDADQEIPIQMMYSYENTSVHFTSGYPNFSDCSDDTSTLPSHHYSSDTGDYKNLDDGRCGSGVVTDKPCESSYTADLSLVDGKVGSTCCCSSIDTDECMKEVPTCQIISGQTERCEHEDFLTMDTALNTDVSCQTEFSDLVLKSALVKSFDVASQTVNDIFEIEFEKQLDIHEAHCFVSNEDAASNFDKGGKVGSQNHDNQMVNDDFGLKVERQLDIDNEHCSDTTENNIVSSSGKNGDARKNAEGYQEVDFNELEQFSEIVVKDNVQISCHGNTVKSSQCQHYSSDDFKTPALNRETQSQILNGNNSLEVHEEKFDGLATSSSDCNGTASTKYVGPTALVADNIAPRSKKVTDKTHSMLYLSLDYLVSKSSKKLLLLPRYPATKRIRNEMGIRHQQQLDSTISSDRSLDGLSHRHLRARRKVGKKALHSHGKGRKTRRVPTLRSSCRRTRKKSVNVHAEMDLSLAADSFRDKYNYFLLTYSKSRELFMQKEETVHIPDLVLLRSIEAGLTGTLNSLVAGWSNFTPDLVDLVLSPGRGLYAYFERLQNEGPPPSLQEQMRYEWIRFQSFGTSYTGGGSSIALARNGFYHDSAAGNQATRCFSCGVCYSEWDYFSDVSAVHRRISPDCPHVNLGDAISGNVPISLEAFSQSSAQIPASTASASSQLTSTAVASPSTAGTASTSGVGDTASNSTPQASQEAQLINTLKGTHIGSTGQREVRQPQQPTADAENSQFASNFVYSASRNLVGNPNSEAPNQSANAAARHLPSSRPFEARSTPSTLVSQEAVYRGQEAARAREAAQRANVTNASSSISSNVTTRAGPASSPGPRMDGQPSVPVRSSGMDDQPSVPVRSSGITGNDPRQVVVDSPKYPEYSDMDTRALTFMSENFPSNLDQTPEQMARAGFFYTDVADFTRCFCCGSGLRNWEAGDDPMVEHTRWYPRCKWVNAMMGDVYVQAVGRRHQQALLRQQQERERIEQQQIAHRQNNPPDALTTPAAGVLQEMGYSAERIREAIMAVRRQTGFNTVSAEQALMWILDMDEGGNATEVPQRTRSPPLVQVRNSSPAGGDSAARGAAVTTRGDRESSTGRPATATSSTSRSSPSSSRANTTATMSTAATTSTATSTTPSTATSTTTSTASVGAGAEGGATGSGATGGKKGKSKESETSSRSTKKKKKKKSKTSEKPPTEGATGGGAEAAFDPRSLKEENEKLREMQTCKICMELPVDITLLPCGHLVCCNECAPKLVKCPVCRQKIRGTVKTFMS